MKIFKRKPRIRLYDSRGKRILIGDQPYIDVIVRDGTVHAYTFDNGTIGGPFIGESAK